MRTFVCFQSVQFRHFLLLSLTRTCNSIAYVNGIATHLFAQYFHSIYLTWNSSNSQNKLLFLLFNFLFAIFIAFRIFFINLFHSDENVYVNLIQYVSLKACLGVYARRVEWSQSKWNTYSSDSSFLMISFKSGIERESASPWLHLYFMCKCCLFTISSVVSHFVYILYHCAIETSSLTISHNENKQWANQRLRHKST